MSDVDPAAVKAALSPVPARAGVRVSVLPTGSADCALVEFDDAAYATMALHLLVGSYRCEFAESAIVVSSDTAWFPRHRRSASELTADALTLAWCVRMWGEQAAGRPGPYAQVWRHVLECDGYDGTAIFTTADGGSCGTCTFEFPAIAYHVRCSCGLLELGSAADPYHLSTDSTLSSLADLIVAVDELRREYLSADASYPSWIPGISRTRRPRTGAKAHP